MVARLCRVALVAVLVVAGGCKGSSGDGSSSGTTAAMPAEPVTLSIVGVNDVHGALDRLPVLAGYVANLRKARAEDGGVLVIDAGDMFQGTIESNMNEGAALIDAYEAFGIDAAAIGNHEFDFGPVGPESTPQSSEDDPRGALKARIAEAEFPLLTANLVDAETGAPIAEPMVMREVAGVKVAIIGVSTIDTLRTTMATNVVGLSVEPLAPTIARYAETARKQGAAVVVVAAHAGAVCRELDDPEDTSSCDDGEILGVARKLPAGLVDVIVAGHTHRAVAHRVNGIAIIEQYAKGRAFGRVDVAVDPESGEVTAREIHPPRDLCVGEHDAPVNRCDPGEYEGARVVPSAAVAEAIGPAVRAAREKKGERLGVVIDEKIRRDYDEESALGNLFVDLMRAARPDADVALTNGGGLRADLPEGELTYGRLYEAFPFDNRFATVTLTAGQLAELIAGNLGRSSGFFSISGVRAEARCEGGELEVAVFRGRAKLAPDTELTMVTSDFLATGGLGAGVGDDAVTVDDVMIRDAMAEVVKERGGTLSGEDKALFDANKPRVRYPGKRPVTCGE